MKGRWILLLLLCHGIYNACGQNTSDQQSAINSLPAGFFSKLQRETATLDKKLTTQTKRILNSFKKDQQRLYRHMADYDSNATNSLSFGQGLSYTDWCKKWQKDTALKDLHLRGNYMPYPDSVQGMLSFLQANPALVENTAQLQATIAQYKTLQAKIKGADELRTLVKQQKEQLHQYLSSHMAAAKLIENDYHSISKQLYYYSLEVRSYKTMLNDPDQLTRKAISALQRMPAFQSFFREHSQLAGLFNLPSNYGDPVTVEGLQTRDQVASIIQNQLASSGAAGTAALQSSLESARSQLSSYKDKLSKLGNSGSDIDMPEFKPNEEKTKTFWRRLEYGTNLQTTRSTYAFPTITDLALSVGYKINEASTVGIGASYKLGWGNGIQHISFSSQGMGLRSFLDIRIKNSFSATGGFEYNYTTCFRDLQDLQIANLWTKSGLIGITKTISLKSKVLKKTKLQLLWDFLSYQQIPRTQAILFRVGYAW